MTGWGKVIAGCAAACALLSTGARASAIDYRYDALGRVVSATYPACTQVKYVYDNAGNRTQQSTNGTALLAFDDWYSTPKNTLIQYQVQHNDCSPAGATRTISSVTSPSHGTVTLNTGHTQTIYTPTTGYVGTDSYTYTATDGTNFATATAYVTVTP